MVFATKQRGPPASQPLHISLPHLAQARHPKFHVTADSVPSRSGRRLPKTPWNFSSLSLTLGFPHITMSPETPSPGISGTGRNSLEIWQGLDAVQNLFAANLPWYESKLCKLGISDASRSSILDFRTFFRFDIRQLSMSLRSSHLSSLADNQARDLFARLDKVLHLFEARTEEHVLVLLSGQRGGQPNIAASPNESGAGISSIFWALSRFPTFFARNSSPDPSNPSRRTPLTPPSKPPYPRLEALQSLLGLLDHDADPVFRYGHLINLGEIPGEYEQMLHEIGKLNEFLMTLRDTDCPQTSPGLKNWSTQTDLLDLSLTREASSRLFNALVHSPVECGQAHRGLLHLTGFRSRGRVRTRPSWDMFLSCCSHPLGWLETHCTVWG